MQYRIKSFVYGEAPKPTKATLIDPTGVETPNTVLWERSWPVVASRSLTEGMYLEGTIDKVTKEFNDKIYENFVLNPIKMVTKSYGPPRAIKSEQIAQAQERKSEYIAEAQDRKEQSIAFFNSTNAAIEVCAKLIDFLDDDGKSFAIEQSIIHWRDWFLNEYKKYSDKKSQPF